MSSAMVWTWALAIIALTALSKSYRRPQQRDQHDENYEGNQASHEKPQGHQAVVPFEPAGQFNFLRLPPEVRNEIYRLILVDFDSEGGPYRPWLPAFRQPALTQVNWQIRKETLPMFFAHNMFTLRISYPDSCLDIDHAREEQRWMGFLRGLKLFAASGHLPIVRHLTIEYTDQGVATTITDSKVCIVIESSRFKLEMPDFKEVDSKTGETEDQHRLIWEFLTGTRVGDEDTDWNDADAVDEALGTAIDEFTQRIQDLGYTSEARILPTMMVGRLVEALRALFRGRDPTQRHMVLSVARRYREGTMVHLPML
ncbi:hypothetical protein VM1G_02161 [Cytospora mali]|uniref:Uncharacterized protein n=1 Tax=Cytospora mali TaxID=578113 RepID=A0A194VNW9_CYTMA|nr:hypothetical protein VM1G_02161 [Valsa mali]